MEFRKHFPLKNVLATSSRFKSMAVLVFLGGVVSSCGSTDQAQSELKIGGGQVYSGCSLQEQSRINPAFGILLETASIDFAAFQSCLQSANFVETFGVTTGASIANLLRSSDIASVTCADLRPNVLAEAYVAISGTSMRIDRDFIQSGTPRRIAATIGHEIMHNRGYRHSVHSFGTTYYPLTVPEQVEACILTGSPNPGALSCSSGYEIQNGLCTPRNCTFQNGSILHGKSKFRRGLCQNKIRDVIKYTCNAGTVTESVTQESCYNGPVTD